MSNKNFGRLLVFLVLLGLVPPCSANKNVTNGSFEEGSVNGIPTGWQPMIHTELSEEAHTGKYALRILRYKTQPDTIESGLNQDWTPDSGNPGMLLTQTRGGFEFAYKINSADSANLAIFALPMNSRPFEETGPGRTMYLLPENHVGDGKWHVARFKFDFTKYPSVKYVMFAIRILGKAGDFLIDDIRYLESVGPVQSFVNTRFEEDPENPGKQGQFHVTIRNLGDQETGPIHCVLSSTSGLVIEPANLSFPTIPVDGKVKASWTVKGPRHQAESLLLTSTATVGSATTFYPIKNKFEIISFGPTTPITFAGKESFLECVVKNTGNVIQSKIVCQVKVEGKDYEASVPELLPGRETGVKIIVPTPKETTCLKIDGRIGVGGIMEEVTRTSTLVVMAPQTVPEPSGKLAVIQTDSLSGIENETIRLFFGRSSFGYGPAWIDLKTENGWKTVAQLPTLSQLIWNDNTGQRQQWTVLNPNPPKTSIQSENGTESACLDFPIEYVDTDSRRWTGKASFFLKAGSKSLHTLYTLSVNQPVDLLCFDGPMVYVLERDRAVYPGLEWLVEGEHSSSTLDIKEGHPHQIRYVVHPNMITIPAIGIHSRQGALGLIWDPRQPWDGTHDRPSVVFASPDRFNHQRSHLMGLFVPSIPQFVKINDREATTPYRFDPTTPIQLNSRLWLDPDGKDELAAVDEWYASHQLPSPPPLPHGGWHHEVQFSMRGYFESLWDQETQKWWLSKRGPASMSKLDRPVWILNDLLMGEILSPDPQVQTQCRNLAETICKLNRTLPRLDVQRLGPPTALIESMKGSTAAALSSRNSNHLWVFDADREDADIFKDYDYHQLGPDNAEEIGLCTDKLREIMRYVLLSGDQEVFAEVEKTLEQLEKFDVPRAAQVWEVPVHTPDILASADAVDTYLRAYQYSQNPHYLEKAVEWARTGLPFVYVWVEPEFPFVLGASIPVFGATQHTYSWFGLPVQWNGLRYADAILALAEYDQSYPWKEIAERLVISAIYQQALEGEDVALWPDNTNAITGERCPWVFAPRQILSIIYKFIGYNEDFQTTLLSTKDGPIPISLQTRLEDLEYMENELKFKVDYPDKTRGYVLISNVQEPTQVLIDGKEIPSGISIPIHEGAGWVYDANNALLTIQIPEDQPLSVTIKGLTYCSVQRLPEFLQTIDFQFENSTEGWIPLSNIEGLESRGGKLVGKVTNPDPFMGRNFMKVSGDDIKVIRIRMSIDSGYGAQLYWMTERVPGYTEDAVIVFPLTSDGQMHEYLIPVGDHPAWKGQTITGLRLDPGQGETVTEFAIEAIEGIR